MMSASKFAVVWGFTDGRQVGVLSTHATWKEAEAARDEADRTNTNPSCGHWIEEECARCGRHGTDCLC